MCFADCLARYITKEDRIIKMSSRKKKEREKDREEVFIMCLHLYIYTHTFLTTHQDYDTMQVRVCVCERFPIVLQTLHLIEHSIKERRTEVTIIISLSLLLTVIVLHKSKNRMKNDLKDDHCPPLTFVQG